MFAIGIDVGGTATRAAAVGPQGRILSARREPTPGQRPELMAWIVGAIQELQHATAGDAAVGVGLALPGLVDAARGRVIRSVNLPFLEEFSIREELAGATGLTVALMTDADAATWGEYSACAPRPTEFVHLRLGTGVACAMVVDDRLRPTDPGRTTHWEALVVDRGPNAVPCRCGLRGCLESIASGPAIGERATSSGFEGGLAFAPNPLSTTGGSDEPTEKGGSEGGVRGFSDALLAGLQEAWERNEPNARTIIDEVAHAVASAIWNLRSQISNGLFVCLGGGVVQALPCIVEQTTNRLRSLRDSVLGSAATVDLISARLGDDAGVIGAGLLARA